MVVTGHDPFSGATILCTGGTGSLGSCLVSLFHIRYKPHKILVFSRDEKKQHDMQQQLGDTIPELRLLLGDVRDYPRLLEVMRDVDFVFHAAAMKHIDKCEYSPTEAIKTNVLGSMNVVQACLERGVHQAMLISTDKSAESATCYGATKACAERLFLAANAYNETEFKVCRYGNVIASRGSVVETFLNLKARGVHEFPITHPEATRFWITLPQAAEAVVATMVAKGVKIGIPRIPSMKVVDVARAIDPDCTFRIIGLQKAEKLHECLVSSQERVPGFENGYYSDKNDHWLTAEELRKAVGL